MRSSSSSRWRANSVTTSRGFSRLPSGHSCFDQPGAGFHQRDIMRDDGGDPGTQHFDRNFCSVMQHRQMNLGDGCAGYRFGVKYQKNFGDRFSVDLFQCFEGDVRKETEEPGLAVWPVRRRYPGGRRSRRVESIWPNLTKIGPSASSARRRRSPRALSSRRQNVAALTTGRNRRSRSWARKNSSRPKRNATASILRRRKKRIYSYGWSIRL